MANYAKSRIDITTTTWTPVIAPIHCNYFGLKNSDGTELLMRTTECDAQTEETLGAAVQELVIAPAKPHADAHRFRQGETILCVKAKTGVGPVIVTWVA